MKRVLKSSLTLGLVMFLGLTAFGQAFKMGTPISVVGEVKWGYVSTHSTTHQIYLAHGDFVDVFSPLGDRGMQILGMHGAKGLCIPRMGSKAYVSNSNSGTISVINLTNNVVEQDIPVGEAPGFVTWDPATHSVLVSLEKANQLCVIQDTTYEILKNVELSGKPAEITYDGKGIAYVCIQDKDQVAVVDITRGSISNVIDLEKGKSPTGIAYDKATQLLFVGCQNKIMEVIDTKSGQTYEKKKIGEGCGSVIFDPLGKFVYVSNSDGTLNVFKVRVGKIIDELETIKTKKGAPICGIDFAAHRILIPCGDVIIPKDGKKGGQSFKPGSLSILILERDKSVLNEPN